MVHCMQTRCTDLQGSCRAHRLDIVISASHRHKLSPQLKKIKAAGLASNLMQHLFEVQHLNFSPDEPVHASCRDELRQWLEGTFAELPCNLPDQLQCLVPTASTSAAEACQRGPITRRDMLELLSPGAVKAVSCI